MQAALTIDMPNYASSAVSTSEIVKSLLMSETETSVRIDV